MVTASPDVEAASTAVPSCRDQVPPMSFLWLSLATVGPPGYYRVPKTFGDGKKASCQLEMQRNMKHLQKTAKHLGEASDC